MVTKSGIKKNGNGGAGPKKQAFLSALGKSWNISAACEGLICRATVYDWLRDDPVFKVQFEAVREAWGERLEEEAIKRATRAKAPSDVLLIFLLKAWKPEKFGERQKYGLDEDTKSFLRELHSAPP